MKLIADTQGTYCPESGCDDATCCATPTAGTATCSSSTFSTTSCAVALPWASMRACASTGCSDATCCYPPAPAGTTQTYCGDYTCGEAGGIRVASPSTAGCPPSGCTDAVCCLAGTVLSVDAATGQATYDYGGTAVCASHTCGDTSLRLIDDASQQACGTTCADSQCCTSDPVPVPATTSTATTTGTTTGSTTLAAAASVRPGLVGLAVVVVMTAASVFQVSMAQ